ncbi:bZIP transcription factor TRAB1-like [Primulina eburnea]|uniref:bZIP transcription factor TRAB1-like n=1 Tax=Primulina eburnea TaxID=1245227 RepID=UPI003C6C940A
METDLNFKDFGNRKLAEGDGGEVTPFSFPLSRQTSVYSLTFDEFQNTVGGFGKDFGSMNMDEFLKNIWSAEENQNIGSITGGGGSGGDQEVGAGGGCLQRQGSLTIPRTLSLKTVDEVWQDMLKECGGGIESSGGGVGASGSQREPTLGEMTLEDFLAKAGIVRDEDHVTGRPNNDPSNNWDFRFDNQQENGNGDLNTINAGIAESRNQIARPANLPLNINFGGQQEPLQLQQLLHSPTVVTSNGQLRSPGAMAGILGITSQKINNTGTQNTVLQGGGLGIHGLGNNGVGFSAGSPAVSSDDLKGNGGMSSSVSPTPYMFSGLRGRKMAAVEKVLERRQRRMIKNRESAARSRARKQAYTRELEEEVAKLKEENQELQKKQAGMKAMQKSLIREMTNQQMNGAKRPCLRRTNTGPW